MELTRNRQDAVVQLVAAPTVRGLLLPYALALVVLLAVLTLMVALVPLPVQVVLLVVVLLLVSPY